MSAGVYALHGREPSWEQWAWAAILVGGEGSRLAGRAAAFAHRLIDEPPGEIAVLVPVDRWSPRARPTGPVGWRFQRERPGVRLSRCVGSPPRLSIEDTVLDLAAESEATEAIGWLTSAVQRRLITPGRLQHALAGRGAIRNHRLLDSTLVDVAAGAQSPLELRYLIDVERAHGLPSGIRQVCRRGTVADVLYDDFQVLVELDGRLGHAGMGRFRDMARDNTATSDGLATLRYGWGDVVGGRCQVAGQVGGVLSLRGWSGLPARCRLCRCEGSRRVVAA